MARNIEIKARIDSIESLVPIVSALADGGPEIIDQDDTFFACPKGRLKLRVFADNNGQLIFYQRPDQTGPKLSNYVISPTGDPDSLRETLTLSYGQTVRVRKRRILYMIGQTRVHLDDVEGLGHFLELEVVLGEGESAELGVGIAQELLEKLNIQPDALIESAYADMLSGKPNRLVRHVEPAGI